MTKEEKREAKLLKKKAQRDKLLARTGWQKFRDVVLKIVIVVALMVAVYPFARDWYIQLMAQPQKITPELVAENNKKPFVTEDIKPVTDKDILSGINWNMSNVIGAIYMPTIKTSTMISRGFTNDGMYTSVGTMTENQIMGQGNYPLAGHNMFVEHVLFTSIDDLQIGDPIYLTDATYIYTYETSEVKPRESVEKLSVVEDRGKNEVTLMSCTDDAYSTNYAYRKISRGNFVKKELIKDADKKVVKAFKLN